MTCRVIVSLFWPISNVWLTTLDKTWAWDSGIFQMLFSWWSKKLGPKHIQSNLALVNFLRGAKMFTIARCLLSIMWFMLWLLILVSIKNFINSWSLLSIGLLSPGLTVIHNSKQKTLATIVGIKSFFSYSICKNHQ